MHDIRDERPTASLVVATEVSIDFDSVRRAIVERAVHRSNEIAKRYLRGQDGDVMFERAVSAKADKPFGHIGVSISSGPEDYSMQHFAFGIGQLSDDTTDPSYVVLECLTESCKGLGELLATHFGELSGDSEPDSHRYFVMMIEPTLHTIEQGPNLVVEAVACIKDDLRFTPSAIRREAARQLLAVA